MQMFRELYVE